MQFTTKCKKSGIRKYIAQILSHSQIVCFDIARNYYYSQVVFYLLYLVNNF